MAIVSVRINGRDHNLACDDGQEEQLVALSQEVDDRVRQLAQQIPHAGEVMLMLLSSLTLADELADTRRQVRQLQGRMTRLEASVDEEKLIEDQAKLAEIEAAMAATLEDVALRIEKIAEQLETR